MKIKSVVKVMNFHSLLRVDKARKEAEKYFLVEKELNEMIDSIVNNRNIILDKQIVQIDSNKPVLNIYIGSDLGFCGNYNHSINNEIRKDDSDKIVIGKKIFENVSNLILKCEKEEYIVNPDFVTDYIKNSIIENKYSEINVLYNCYQNVSTITLEKRKIYPLDLAPANKNKYTEDFISESEISSLIKQMISTYVDYELQIIVKNSFASENIMRQSSTNNSLKKIDELQEIQDEIIRKQNVIIESGKNIEMFSKRKERLKRLNG